MKGFKVSRNKVLRNAYEALRYCQDECPDFKLGCAAECKIRKHFKIPPHGEKYPKQTPNSRYMATIIKPRLKPAS